MTFGGEVEAAAAVAKMDGFLEASSLEDRTAVLAELRRLHVMADPHRCAVPDIQYAASRV